MAIAPVNNPIRRAFAPYFKARWQNYQNVISNYAFYSEMPPEWVTYQNAYVKQWEQWSSGFVLTLHRGDFFATGMGKTVCDILTRECMRGRFRFDGDNPNLVKYVTRWGEDNDLSGIVGKGFDLSSRMGNAILRLNIVAGTGEIYPSIHGINRTYFEVNRREEIVKAKFLDYLSANTTAVGGEYYTIEDRVWQDNAPYYRVRLYHQSGTVTSPTFLKCANDLKTLDICTQSKFADLYGDIELDTWYQLPYKTLGCYNWRANAVNSALSSMPGYADSDIHTALDILYAIDYNWSLQQLDMYWGRTRVTVPREMQTPQNINYIRDGQSFAQVQEQFENAPLSDDVFLQTPNGNVIDAKPVQPLFIQPDYRESAHKAIRDADIELLASKVGISAGKLFSHLSGQSVYKSESEIESDVDATDVTVGHKRELADTAINAMIADVLDYYDLVGDVDITWNSEGSAKRNADMVIAQYTAQLMPRAEAIKRLHPELTQAEVDEWVSELDVRDSVSEVFDVDKAFV